MRETDILVIGSGIAGLTFALDAARDRRVTVLTKSEALDCASNESQGGIAAVFGDDDSADEHIRDTLVAGAGLCNRDAVEIIVREGPAAVRELVARGVDFARRNGGFDLGREGGHSHDRIVHAGDITGRAIMQALTTAVRNHPNIEMLEHRTLVDIVTNNEHTGCIGARVINENGEVEIFSSSATILATGGCGNVYARTTNPSIATGDGIAAAWRAGAPVANLEFMQFHPTVMLIPGQRPFLISEALRGFGAEIVRSDGTAFLQHYHPLGSLAPRDVVSRAIAEELLLSGKSTVFLDLRKIPAEDVRKRFPTIDAVCRRSGIDMTHDLVPVVPAAHYMCGGVITDLRGETGIKRLYACGEVACTGVHGANRLASNSLLEGLVFAKRAADNVLSIAAPAPAAHPTNGVHPPRFFDAPVPFYLQRIRGWIQNAMESGMGIIRTDAGLRQAEQQVQTAELALDAHFRQRTMTTASTEVRNLATVALLMVRSAQARHESRGTHYNADHPHRNELLDLHSHAAEVQ